MRTTWAWVLVPVAAVSVLVGLWRNASAATDATKADVPIGVVDMVKVFNENDQWKAINTGLTRKRQGQDAEAEKFKEQIAAKQKQLDAYHPDSPDWLKCSEELLSLNTKAEVWARLEKARTERMKKQWVEKNYADVTKAIADVAKKRGLAIVFTREEIEPNTEDSARLFAQIINRKVVYHEPGLEITQDVLKKVNDEFKLAGGEGSLKIE